MPHVSRRAFTGGLLASAFMPTGSAVGQPSDPGSIAIVDTPYNAAKVASKLSAQNVKVVVRFFARKPQPGLREKRIGIGFPDWIPHPQEEQQHRSRERDSNDDPDGNSAD